MGGYPHVDKKMRQIALKAPSRAVHVRVSPMPLSAPCRQGFFFVRSSALYTRAPPQVIRGERVKIRRTLVPIFPIVLILLKSFRITHDT